MSKRLINAVPYGLPNISKRSAATLLTQKPKFKTLAESTKEEWEICCKEYDINVMRATHKRLIDLIESQRGEDKKYGHPVDLYEHQLQTATRAYKDGADEEIIIMGLFHDAAECLSPHNHGHTIGNILYPYLSPKAFWMLSHHDIFQTYYYLHHYGVESDKLRSQFKTHEFYLDTIYFCENYDQNSFDDSYNSFPLQHFEKMIERFFEQRPFWWNDGINPRSGVGALFYPSNQ